MASTRMIPLKDLTILASRVSQTSGYSTAASQASKAALRNRPLSPFLAQKRPEMSSTKSIGERILLITLGVVILPAPEIAKFLQFMY